MKILQLNKEAEALAQRLLREIEKSIEGLPTDMQALLAITTARAVAEYHAERAEHLPETLIDIALSMGVDIGRRVEVEEPRFMQERGEA